MSRISCMILAASVITFADVASASNWELILTHEFDSQQPRCHQYLSIDKESITRSDNIITMWSKGINGPTHTACPNYEYREILLLNELDCSSQMICATATHATKWDGKTEGGDTDCIWSHVIPDSIGDSIYSYGCSHYDR